jgi:hypothetical protein
MHARLHARLLVRADSAVVGLRRSVLPVRQVNGLRDGAVTCRIPERPLLGEYSRPVLDRTIFEAKYRMNRYAAASSDLSLLTIGDRLAFQCLQHKKAMH